MRYQKIITALFLLTGTLTSKTQTSEKKYGLDFADVYVITVRFDQELIQNKSYCVYENGTKCILYKIKVTDVMYCPLNTVTDSIGLMNFEYIIAPIAYADSIKMGNEFLITAMPSTSKQYLALTRMLNKELINNHYGFYHKYAYLSGLIKCKRKQKDLFIKYTVNK